jgi:hypothetical protein
MDKQITFTPASAKLFAKIHNKAVREGAQSFIFNEDEYVTAYAHYMLEYMVMNKIIAGKFDDNKVFVIK